MIPWSASCPCSCSASLKDKLKKLVLTQILVLPSVHSQSYRTMQRSDFMQVWTVVAKNVVAFHKTYQIYPKTMFCAFPRYLMPLWTKTCHRRLPPSDTRQLYTFILHNAEYWMHTTTCTVLNTSLCTVLYALYCITHTTHCTVLYSLHYSIRCTLHSAHYPH